MWKTDIYIPVLKLHSKLLLFTYVFIYNQFCKESSMLLWVVSCIFSERDINHLFKNIFQVQLSQEELQRIITEAKEELGCVTMKHTFCNLFNLLSP